MQSENIKLILLVHTINRSNYRYVLRIAILSWIKKVRDYSAQSSTINCARWRSERWWPRISWYITHNLTAPNRKASSRNLYARAAIKCAVRVSPSKDHWQS